MDALNSFTTLADSIPNWLERVEKLSQQVSDRYAEFTRLSRNAGTIGSIRRKKTGSTESLRPNDDTQQPVTTSNLVAAPPPVRVDVNPDSKRLFQDFRDQARRKRKSTSIMTGASGPQRFRQRYSLIVYYDSSIQEGFEWLVRSISGARNNLRKGKTAASFKARLTSLGMEESPFIGDRTDLSLRNPHLPRFPRSYGRFMTDGSSSPTEAFDSVDKELEAAQSLCEVGAHQFLRDGNCCEELSGTMERFNSCLKTAQAQIEIFKIEAEKEKELEAERQMERTQRDLAIGAPIEIDNEIEIDDGIEIDGMIHVDGTIQSDNTIQVDSITVDTKGLESGIEIDQFGLGGGAIEIDDNQDSNSFHIDLTAFRKTRRY